MLELAAAKNGVTLRGETIARAQRISLKYLENILAELRRARLVQSQRGPEGGYVLARPASTISLADVIRAIDGPLAGVRGAAPESVTYPGVAARLRDVWVAVRANLRAILEHVTLADVVRGRLPASVRKLLRARDAWVRR